MKMGKLWYLIYVKENKESRVVSWLNSKKIENFYPVTKRAVKGFFGTKEITSGIFPSRIFVNIDRDELQMVVSNHLVISVVHWKSEPVVVSERTISGIRTFLRRYRDVRVQERELSEKDFTSERNTRTTIKGTIASLFVPELGYVLTSQLEKEPAEWVLYDPVSRPAGTNVSVMLFGAESQK